MASSASKVLVIDVGGSNVKLSIRGLDKPLKIESSNQLTPRRLLTLVCKATEGWRYNRIALGIPAPVKNSIILEEPKNLGKGWTKFDFAQYGSHPIRILNDAALQALGSWEGGRMLFLGLGTGLGSALVVEGSVIGLELCELHFNKSKTLEDMVRKSMLKQVGATVWLSQVREILAPLQAAFLPDEIVIGGGNAKYLKGLPKNVRVGSNSAVQRGGERLWETTPTPSRQLRWQIF